MLLNKRGFYDTLEVLDKENELSIHDFYQLFNEKSYYNAHLRVRDEMIELGIIKINGKMIILTEKGKQICSLLTLLKCKMERGG